VINSGSWEQPISKSAHGKDFARAVAAAGWRVDGLTHAPRRAIPPMLRAMFSTTLEELKNLGIWEKSTMTNVYTKLISADTAAQVAGCATRVTYYCIRADLHPSDFTSQPIDLRAMTASLQFNVAGETASQMRAVSLVLRFGVFSIFASGKLCALIWSDAWHSAIVPGLARPSPSCA
jgi:hypothetical protein